jgi:hypothetical protein
MITLSSGIQTRVTDKCLVDSLEGTVVWDYDLMACPQMVVQLYKGLMKVYTNQTNVLEASPKVIEHKTRISLHDWKQWSPLFCVFARLTRLK